MVVFVASRYFHGFCAGLTVLVLLIALVSCDSSGVPSVVPQPVATPISLTPAPGTGIVKGVILNYQTKEPLSESVVYLGEIIKSTTSDDEMASLEPVSAPRAYSDEHGNFAFVNLLPKEYVVAASTPRGQVFLIDPNTQNEIRVTVIAGQVKDIGTVYLDLSGFK